MRLLKSLTPLIAVAGIALGAATAAAEPLKIRMAYVVPVANWASILFEKPGLAQHMGKSYTLEVTQYKGTPPQITALANNELDIADLAFSSFALAVQNAGMNDLRVIADEFQDGVDGYYSNEFFVHKDSDIKTVKDLKGKVVATNAVGSAVDIVMRSMLRKNGLNDQSDVSTVEAAFPNMYAMLSQKKVDAIPGVVPFSFNPKLREESRVLFTQKEAVGRTQMIVWAARAGFLEKNHAAMLDFMEDAVRAVHWWQDPKNHAEAVEIAARVSKRPAASFDAWLFVRAGQKGDYYRDPNLVPDLEALQANISLQHELGLLKAPLDVKKHADLSLVTEAAKRVK